MELFCFWNCLHHYLPLRVNKSGGFISKKKVIDTLFGVQSDVCIYEQIKNLFKTSGNRQRRKYMYEGGNAIKIGLTLNPRFHIQILYASYPWWFMQPLREECRVMDLVYPPHGIRNIVFDKLRIRQYIWLNNAHLSKLIIYLLPFSDCPYFQIIRDYFDSG